VDGHTDNIPISGGIYADNWELSQARALSVVRYMVNQLGFPPERLAATGSANTAR
jgi:chemotaxis protein MotB